MNIVNRTMAVYETLCNKRVYNNVNRPLYYMFNSNIIILMYKVELMNKEIEAGFCSCPCPAMCVGLLHCDVFVSRSLTPS